jgi:hypothetical protein
MIKLLRLLEQVGTFACASCMIHVLYRYFLLNGGIMQRLYKCFLLDIGAMPRSVELLLT